MSHYFLRTIFLAILMSPIFISVFFAYSSFTATAAEPQTAEEAGFGDDVNAEAQYLAREVKAYSEENPYVPITNFEQAGVESTRFTLDTAYDDLDDPTQSKSDTGDRYCISGARPEYAQLQRCSMVNDEGTLVTFSQTISGGKFSEGSTSPIVVEESRDPYNGPGAGVIFSGVLGGVAGLGLIGGGIYGGKKLVDNTRRGAKSRKSQKAIIAHRKEAVNAATSKIASVKVAWHEYEHDIDQILAYPVLQDSRDSHTSAFYRYLMESDDRHIPSEFNDYEGYEEYTDFARDFELSWRAAQQNAKRIRLSGFQPKERASIEQAIQLLKTARDESATPEERQLAYERAMKNIEHLVTLPEETKKELEEIAYKRITA